MNRSHNNTAPEVGATRDALAEEVEPPAREGGDAIAVPRSPGRRRRKQEANRAAIVASALSLVRDRGIHRMRIEDITEACDVAKGAFYLHFRSKDALLAELLARAVALLESACREEVKGHTGLEQRVRAVVRAHAGFLAANAVGEVLLHQGRGHLQLAEGADSALASVYRRYLEWLAALTFADSPTVPEARRLELATLVAGAIAGQRSFRAAARVDASEALVEDALGLALPALVARATGAEGRP